jgi:hypothetical protein
MSKDGTDGGTEVLVQVVLDDWTDPANPSLMIILDRDDELKADPSKDPLAKLGYWVPARRYKLN